MNFVLQPWQLFVLIVAGWINREQQKVIEYLRTENAVLKEKLGKNRILLNDDQRRRLAVKGKVLGRKLLQRFGTLFTPDTILRWHRQLVAKKWDTSAKRQPGRPPIRQVIVDLILRFAKENPSWGYDRIQGALANVGYHIADTTVGNILKGHGIEPAPDRKQATSWSTFLKAHWDVIAATDFLTVEVWTKQGLITYYVLFVIELATRRVEITGITTSPNESWMRTMACNLANFDDGFLDGKCFLIHDRDTKFCAKFLDILASSGIESIKLPPRSPNLNAYAERFVLSLKQECLDRMIFFGESSLRNALNEFVKHYHAERNHQGIDNRLIAPQDITESTEGEVTCRDRLGGILKYYHRRAA
jgi:putative transposase